MEPTARNDRVQARWTRTRTGGGVDRPGGGIPSMDSSIGDREQTGYIEEGELAIEFGFSGAVLTRSVAHV